jgi:hypothetical protein
MGWRYGEWSYKEVERTMIITLKFENRTAEDCIEMQVDRYAAGHIMDWYGAFYAGDDYDVFINGTLASRSAS